MITKWESLMLYSFFVLAGIALFVLMFWMFRTEKRLKKFFMGKKAKDLEETVEIMQKNITELQSAKDRVEKELVTVNQKLRKSVRGLETIRFNPFQDQGSNQSFTMGILNEDGDGVILSSLYSRERNSVFAKPVKALKSEYELTEEEKEVLAKAKINDSK